MTEVAKNAPAAKVEKSLADRLWSVSKGFDAASIPGVVMPSKPGGDRGWPAQYQALADPPIIDKSFALREMKEATGLGTLEHVHLPFTDTDYKAWQDKEKVQHQKQFDEWVGSRFNAASDPAEREFLRKIYPEYFEARLRENEALLKLKADWSRIGITGPTSLEDLYMVWRYDRDGDLRARLDQVGSGPEHIGQSTSALNMGLVNKGKWTHRKPFSRGPPVYSGEGIPLNPRETYGPGNMFLKVLAPKAAALLDVYGAGIKQEP